MRQCRQPTHSNENKHHHRVRREGISLDGALEVNRTFLWRKNGIYRVAKDAGNMRLHVRLECVKCVSVTSHPIPTKINTTIASAMSELV